MANPARPPTATLPIPSLSTLETTSLIPGPSFSVTASLTWLS